MKTKLFFLLAITVLLAATLPDCGHLLAQAPPTAVADTAAQVETIAPAPAAAIGAATDLERLYLGISAVLMVLLPLLLGKLAPKWAWVKDDRNKDLMVKSLAAAVLVGVTMWQLGLTGINEQLISFLCAVFGYDKVLSPLGMKTHSPAPKK